MAEQLVTPSSK